MQKHELGGYEISVIAVDEARELYGSNKSLQELFEYTKMHDQVLLTIPRKYIVYGRKGPQFFKFISS